MSKKIVLLIALISGNFVFSQINQGKVTYKSAVNIEKKAKKIDGNNEVSEKYKKMMLELTSNSDDVIFILTFNKDESLFYSDKKVEMENDGESKMNFTKILTDEKSLYYLNMKTKEKFKQSSTFSKILISLDPTNWKLTQESRKIGKYKCYKALTKLTVEGRNGVMTRFVTAWYTPEIPVNFGVQSFNGLPGLTLELDIDGRVFFKAVKIELNPNEKIIITKPKGKKVSSEEFNEMLKNARNR